MYTIDVFCKVKLLFLLIESSGFLEIDTTDVCG